MLKCKQFAKKWSCNMIDEHDDIELNCTKNMETTEQIKMIKYRNIVKILRVLLIMDHFVRGYWILWVVHEFNFFNYK